MIFLEVVFFGALKYKLPLWHLKCCMINNADRSHSLVTLTFTFSYIHYIVNVSKIISQHLAQMFEEKSIAHACCSLPIQFALG